MENRKEFYEITQKDSIFTAIMTGCKTIIFQEKVQDLQQFGVALITTNMSGTHDLYLPTKYNVCGSTNYYYNKIPCLPVLKDIKSYQYWKGLFLLRLESFCTFIVPSDYTWCLSDLVILEGRKNNLPKLFAKTAFIREDFFSTIAQGNCFLCNADNVDYLILPQGFYATDVEPQLRIIQLGKAEPIGSNLMVTSKKGQYMLSGEYTNNYKIYDSLVPFSETDYPPIFPKEKGYYGYWNKKDGNYLGLSICSAKNDLFLKNYYFSKPVSQIIFMERCDFSKNSILAWKLICSDGEEKLLLNMDNSFKETKI